MVYTRAQYAANRDALLQRIIAFLSSDERFVAAWLEGSLGREGGDELSDIDIRVVVAQEYAEQLCSCAPQAATRVTSSQRLALYERFGSAIVLREDSSFVPGGGCFNHVVYRDTAITVDWVLMEQAKAVRPEQCRMLFDQVGIPLAPPPVIESPEERAEKASANVGFFWLMLAIGIKYMLRGEIVALYGFLGAVYGALQEVQRLVAGKPWQPHPSLSTLATTRAEQIVLIRRLCAEMLEVMPGVEQLGGYIPPDPMHIIDVWLSLAVEPEGETQA
ncbi:MAG: hypothetical protein J2P36_30120 [Ktedonobacteraceae bacterium]|nr:hypothetical protein [Ktedonobacteraceae bacterium]